MPTDRRDESVVGGIKQELRLEEIPQRPEPLLVLLRDRDDAADSLVSHGAIYHSGGSDSDPFLRIHKNDV